MEQAHGSETDHGDGEDSMTYARDPHRHVLQVMLQFMANPTSTSNLLKLRDYRSASCRPSDHSH
jgi:hypothetical protein